MGMSAEAMQRIQEQADAMASQLASKQGAGASEYDAVLATFGAIPSGPVTPSKGVQSQVRSTSPSGMILYENGAIYDPTTRETLFPTNPNAAISTPGSEVWLRDIQDSWSDEKAEEWREKLWKEGYQGADALQADKGGWGLDLVNALRMYHTNRYSNFGKAQPLVPQGGAANIGRGKQMRDAVDKTALRAEVKSWGDIPFAEELDDDTADYFADRVMDVAARLAKQHKGWDSTQILEGAKGRVVEEFADTPGVKGALREAEEDEMDESLRENIASLSQLSSL